MRDVAIVGVGTMPWYSRYAHKTWLDLALEATDVALTNSGLQSQDVDSVVYSVYCDLMLRQHSPTALLQDYLGMEGKPAVRLMAGAATEVYSIHAAYAQVASGMADVVLCTGVQKGQDWYSFDTRSRGDGLLKGFSISTNTTWLEPVVPGVPPFLTATYLVPHMERFGGPTIEQIARVSEKNHDNALVNSEAQLKIKVSWEDVLNSRIIAWPTTKLECCLYSDCSAALVLASEEKARELTDKPIWITGTAVASSYPFPQYAESDDFGTVVTARLAAQRAYQMAGIDDPINQLDVVELHDLVSGLEVILYEDLGLCERGEGGKLVDEGVIYKDGSLPVNPSGGRVACGHVAGVSGVYSTAKVVEQLREEAGPLQVPIESGRALVHSTCGLAGLTGVNVFEREG